MLDFSNEATVSDLWDGLEVKAVLPSDSSDFFSKSGPKAQEEERDFERFYMRVQAIAQRKSETYGVFMKDCSRAGMGFVSPVQFFPRERVELSISAQRCYSLEIVRCRRIQPDCYECGAIFILGEE